MGCVASLTVLRVSFGLSVFFFLMFLSTVGAKEEGSCRDWWHSGWWPIKIAGYLLVLLLAFLLPYRESLGLKNTLMEELKPESKLAAPLTTQAEPGKGA